MVHAPRNFCPRCSNTCFPGYIPVYSDVRTPSGKIHRVVVAMRPCLCSNAAVSDRKSMGAGEA